MVMHIAATFLQIGLSKVKLAKLESFGTYVEHTFAEGVFFCDSLDPCFDPCHVIKHESQPSIFSLKKSYVMIHVYT